MFIQKLGIGTWQTFTRYANVCELEEMLNLAKERGITLIDTADSYDDGGAEKLLGQILLEFPANSFEISTKCFFPTGISPIGGLNSKHVRSSCAASQERLQLECIDTFYAHRYDPTVHVEDVAETFNQLILEKKIKKWGICKWPLEKADELIRFCIKNNLHGPSSQQFHYNLLNREAEALSFPLYDAYRVPTASYSPLAQGVLTGKYGRGIDEGSRASIESTRKTMWDLQDSKLVKINKWKNFLAGKNTTSTAVAIAFCLNRTEISHVLLGARNKEQLFESLQSVDMVWDPLLVELFDEM